MSELEEKKNKKIGLMVSMGLHVALLILFFFILAWRAPNPPHPEYGIELNFGLDNAGSGAIQPQNRPTPLATPEPEKPSESRQEQAQPRQEPRPEPVTRNEAESPSVVQPEPSPVTETPTKTEKPIEQTKMPKEEPKTEPMPEPNAESKEPVQNVKEQENADAKTGNVPSQGDQANKTGDQGKPEGTVDARALYGSQGGGGGASFDLAGWNWDYIPKPSESSDETGRIVFRIKVDDRGDITEIVTQERTVSPAVERVYREAVQRVTFSRTSAGPVPPQTTGTITFIIRAR